ncbi:hypothetical protein GJAV_G00231460 [Gymnothorax javanicus]|nr:hypothetical protein GJAV_G00231460 [Gymnothorax javanicus]
MSSELGSHRASVGLRSGESHSRIGESQCSGRRQKRGVTKPEQDSNFRSHSLCVSQNQSHRAQARHRPEESESRADRALRLRTNSATSEVREMSFPSASKLSFWDIHMPFSDSIKYSILGVSVLLLAVAVTILVWQVYRYYTLKPDSLKQFSSLLLGEEWAMKEKSYGSSIQTINIKSQAVEMSLSHSAFPSPPPFSPSPPPSSDGSPWPSEDPAQGSLSFSLLYDRLQSQLLVTALRGWGLSDQSNSAALCPLVRVLLLQAGPKVSPTLPPLCCVLRDWQTRAVTDSADSALGNHFSCPLPENDLSRTTVRLEVKDVHKYSRRKTLGEIRVHLGQLNLTKPLEILQDLQPANKDPVGEVLLSLKYLPTSQRLEVGLLKVRTISSSPSRHRGLYARTSVVCNKFNLRHQKTSLKTRWEMTVFNEVMTFALPGPPIAECSIVVSVYEAGVGTRSSKRLIGQTSLRKGRKTEDQHWSLMMRSIRQPVTQWHLLLV